MLKRPFPLWRKTFVAEIECSRNSAELEFMRYEAATKWRQFSMSHRVHCFCKLSPLSRVHQFVYCPCHMRPMSGNESNEGTCFSFTPPFFWYTRCAPVSCRSPTVCRFYLKPVTKLKKENRLLFITMLGLKSSLKTASRYISEKGLKAFTRDRETTDGLRENAL